MAFLAARATWFKVPEAKRREPINAVNSIGCCSFIKRNLASNPDLHNTRMKLASQYYPDNNPALHLLPWRAGGIRVSAETCDVRGVNKGRLRGIVNETAPVNRRERGEWLRGRA